MMKVIQQADVKSLLAGKYVNRLIEVMKYGGSFGSEFYGLE